MVPVASFCAEARGVLKIAATPIKLTKNTFFILGYYNIIRKKWAVES